MKNKLKAIKRVLFRKIHYTFYYAFSKKNTKQVLYDHLPKCGGTSLGYYLQKHYSSKRFFGVRKPLEKSIAKYKQLSEEQKNKFNIIIGHNAHYLFNNAPKDFAKKLKEINKLDIQFYEFIKSHQS